MADSENPEAQMPATFDTWQQAINVNVKNYKEYLKFAEDNHLTATGEKLAAEFPRIVNDYLSGFEEGSPVARDIRNGLEFTHDICPDPWRAAFVTWCKESDEAAALIAKAKKDPKEFSYHGFIGDLCEAYGQALTNGEHPVISPFHEAASPNAVRYRARLADGKWKDISQEDLVALAREPNGPHIVHSANHAFLDNEKLDLDSLHDAFSELYAFAQLPFKEAVAAKKERDARIKAEKEAAKKEGRKANAIPLPENLQPLKFWDPKNLGPNDTITVFATHTSENRFLNLAQLFRRLDVVDRNQENPKADSFQHVAPIAVDMVETLLKSIVVEGDVVKIDARKKDASGKPIFFDKPITLRADAIDIIRRQRYRGFSKGGNDFRDGMRLLVHALDARDAGGKEKVRFSDETTSIRDLISNMSVIVFGLNEKPMADYYREHGVNVPIISSKNDIIAPPTVEHEANEPAYNYEGKDPKDAEGNHLSDGHAPSYSVDGMLDDWRIHDLLKTHGAVSQGQAAITDVSFVVKPDGSYDHDALSLELAHGTSDAMMKNMKAQLNEALQAQKGLEHVSIARVGDNQARDRYELRGYGLVSKENIEAVQKVLRTLCAEHGASNPELPEKDPSTELLVSQSAAYGKMSLMRRYLADEAQGKIGPAAVIDKATVTSYVRLANERRLREHDRIAPPATSKQQIG